MAGGRCSGLVTKQTWLSNKYHLLTQTQRKQSKAASLSFPYLLAPCPTVLHSMFISSLQINRDTLSVQRGDMFSPATQWIKKDKHTTLLHHRCSFQGRRTGGISHSGHVSVWGFCKTIPKVRCELIPCNTREMGGKQRSISTNPSFFSKRPVALKMKLCGDVLWVFLDPVKYPLTNWEMAVVCSLLSSSCMLWVSQSSPRSFFKP